MFTRWHFTRKGSMFIHFMICSLDSLKCDNMLADVWCLGSCLCEMDWFSMSGRLSCVTRVRYDSSSAAYNLLIVIIISQVWSEINILVSECDNRNIIRVLCTLHHMSGCPRLWLVNQPQYSPLIGPLPRFCNCQTRRIMSSQISNTDISNNYCAGKNQ